MIILVQYFKVLSYVDICYPVDILLDGDCW